MKKQRSSPNTTHVDTNNPSINVDSVTKIYNVDQEDELKAIDDISFEVQSGEFLSIVGPSGCGKTTMLKCIGDIIKPTYGNIYVGGKQNYKSRNHREFAFFFQEDVLFPWRTVLENVMLPLEIQDVNVNKDRCLEILETVGLGGFENKYPAELSGGMRQRVALARGFVYNPKVFLMDEPFAALDELTRREMNKELLRIHEKIEKTTVFVTHHIEEAVWLSDRILIFSPHPGELHATVDIDFPRPRGSDIRESKKFVDIKEDVMNIITSM